MILFNQLILLLLFLFNRLNQPNRPLSTYIERVFGIVKIEFVDDSCSETARRWRASMTERRYFHVGHVKVKKRLSMWIADKFQ